VQGINCLVVLLVRESSEDGRSLCEELAVSGELGGDILPSETSAFDKDPIPHGPAGYGEIDDAEFLSKEVWAADLVDVALEIFDPFAKGGGLELRGLSVEEAEVARYDELVDEIDPDPGLSGEIGVGRYHMGFVLGVGIFEELEDDMGVVKRSSLMGESRDQSFGVESEQCRVLVERVSLDVLVRYSAFLESYPAFLCEGAEPTAVQDELAVSLVIAGGRFREPCGVGVKLEDVYDRETMDRVEKKMAQAAEYEKYR